MRLIYLCNNRLPTEKAHGLQIVQMCEAFADAGSTVTLVSSRRINTAAMRAVPDLWSHYGVKQNFTFRRLVCLDLIDTLPARIQRLTFLLQTLTYLIALLIWLLPRRADVFYTRDLFIAVLVKLIRPRVPLAYEVHQLSHSRLGSRLQCWVMRRAYVIAVTQHLAAKISAKRIMVAHDGYRQARFENLPGKTDARADVGIPADAFVVGYVGQLHTMRMSKGLDTLVDAIAQTPREVHLLVVGGPAEGVEQVRQQWQACGLPADLLHTSGQVRAEAVPRYMAAMDVGAMPLPWTEHFAYYASAIKLFEYMAAGCVLLASDLPSTAEVVQNEVSALLAPPGDGAAFAASLQRLADDADLCAYLSQQAKEIARQYTWEVRAARIIEWVQCE